MFAVFRKIRNLPLSIDLQLKLFDTLVLPILTYSCEVWGFENISDIERVHLGFCKQILKIRGNTPNFMVYGELGRFPLSIHINVRMIGYWLNLKSSNKLSTKLLSILTNLKNSNNDASFRWLNHIEQLFNSTGLNYIFTSKELELSSECIKIKLKKTLQDQFIQSWYSDIEKSSRGEFYGTFKTEFKLEPYLLRLNYSARTWLCKLRTNNINIPIETGRWVNVNRENRFCKLCFDGIGDEFHYLFICEDSNVKILRAKYIPTYFTRFPSHYKMKGLLSICHTELLTNISYFVKHLCKLM